MEASQSVGAVLLVSGAYSHSRMEEWIFGGATRAFMDKPDGPHLLISH